MGSFQRGITAFLLGWALWLPLAAQDQTDTVPKEYLRWNTGENRVDADIRSWTLETLLKQISQSTGWRVFLEPGTERLISAKFHELTPDKALEMLLGNLSRALVPQESGPPHFLVFRTTRQEATQAIEPHRDPASGRIPNELVVVLKPGESIDAIAKELGAKVVAKIDGQNAYRLEFEDEASANAAREKLATDERVASVEDNYRVARNLPMELGASFSGSSLKRGSTGCPNQITVALIDTAIQAQATGIADFVKETISLAGESVLPGTYPLHGDIMSQSILKGLEASLSGDRTTEVFVQPYDVYGAQEMTTTFTVAQGVYEAWQSGASIINMSLGSADRSPLLHQIIQAAAKDDVLLFAAAGNEPVATETYPAAFPEVIAVTAGNRDGQIAPFANFGAFVEVVGPPATRVQFNGQAWNSYGTSVSSATVAGIAAGMMQNNCQGAASVAAQIRQSLPFLGP